MVIQRNDSQFNDGTKLNSDAFFEGSNLMDIN